MGLQSQLNDVSSDSIPLLLVALIANCVASLRCLLFGFLHSLGLSRFDPNRVDDGLLSAVGSGLAGLIALADQLNNNQAFSYEYAAGEDGVGPATDPMDRPICVVCRCALRDGDHVRRLPCRHVSTRSASMAGLTISSSIALFVGRPWCLTSAWLSQAGAWVLT
ncbi:hypothetical protein SLA2020_380660 [Shorea laevis]